MKKLLSIFAFFLVSQLQVFAQGIPNIAGFYLDNKPFNDFQTIELFAGDTLKLEWHGTVSSSNADSLYLSSNITSVLPGATFSAVNGKSASAYFHWVAAAADVSFTPYELTLTLKDNGKPITGVQILPLKIRVNKPGSISLNNGRVNLSREILVQPGSLFNFRLSSVNASLSDSISITSNAAAVLYGSTFTTDNTKQQTATINWTPTVQMSGNVSKFTITLTEKRSPNPKQYVYTVTVRVGNVLAVKTELNYEQIFTAYPNPFSDQVSFKFDQAAQAENIIIYNLLGQQIEEIKLQTVGVGEQKVQWQNAAKHATGTYIARLISAEKTIQTLKFIKL